MSGIEHDPAVRRRGLPREQYDLLVGAGALDGQPVELLEGRIVEIAHSSRRTDLIYKSRIYAEAEVAEYWVLDLPAREVVVHTRPHGGPDPGYREVRRVGDDTELSVLGVRVRLADLLD